MNKVKISLFIISILFSVRITANSVNNDCNTEFESSFIQNIVAPSFTNISGVPISGSLDFGSVINIGLTPISISSKLYLYFEHDGIIDESVEIDFQKINKESVSNTYTHHLSKSIIVTAEGISEIIIYRLQKLKISDRIKIVIKDGSNSLESRWYNIERNLIFKNFRFTWQIDVLLKNESNNILNVRDDRKYLYKDYDKSFLKESPRIFDVPNEFRDVYLVGELDNDETTKNNAQKYNFERPRIFNSDSPESLPIELYVKRGDKIISKIVERKISLSKSWPGKRSIYEGVIELDNLFSIDIKHGDQIVARSTQFFKNSPIETSIKVNNFESISDCEKELVGQGTNTTSVDFFTNKANNDEKASFNKNGVNIRLEQEFYFEIYVLYKGDMCLDGWVDVVVQDVKKNIFTRNRVHVDMFVAYEGDKNDYFTKYRSSKIKLSYSAGENQIEVGELNENSNNNRLWVISSNEEFENLKTNGSLNTEHDIGYEIILPPLDSGEGLLTIGITQKEYYDVPKGKIIITGINDFIIENESTSWTKKLPVGIYKAEYEVMGERFGVKDIYVENDTDRTVHINAENEIGQASMKPEWQEGTKDIDKVFYYAKTDFITEFSRNGESEELRHFSTKLLHRGKYKISLNNSKNLLFPVRDIDITIVPNEETTWPSPIGILILKKNKEKDGGVIRSAAIVKGKDGESPLFAFSENTGKFLPVGVYTIELQKANSIKKVTKEFEIKASEYTIIDADFDTDSKGQVHMKALDKDGEEIEYFVRINQDDKYLKSAEGIGLTVDLPTGIYNLIFSIVGKDDVERNIEVVKGEITEVVIGEKNEPINTNLNGDWKYHNEIIHISQNGSSIKGDYKRKVEWNYSMQGLFDGKTFKGKWFIIFPLEWKQKCPQKWNYPAKLELTLSRDGNTLEGRIEHLTINDNCETTSVGWLAVKIILTRNILLESKFNGGDESWEFIGARASRNIGDGNLSAMTYNPFDKEIWYFKAPSKYHGNWVAYYDKVLTFRLKTDQANGWQSLNDSDDVVLKGANMTLVYDIENPGRDWTTYRIPIHQTAGWINKATGKSVTLIELKEVLNNVSELLIKGEFNGGRKTTWLDDVGIR